MGVAQRKRTKRKVTIRIKKPKLARKIDIGTLDPRIKKLWDTKKTLHENYKAIGIAYEYNNIKPLQDVLQRALEGDEFAGEEEEIQAQFHMESKKPETPFDDFFPTPPEQPKREPRLSEDERSYYKALIKKHGSNYKAMSTDIKVNNYQHTAKTCKKKCELYLQKYAKS